MIEVVSQLPERVADWLRVVPLGAAGSPLFVQDADGIALDSFAEGGILFDENHATELMAPAGLPSPSLGWVVELSVKADGIWGRTEWNRLGKQLVNDRAYRSLSVIVEHDTTGRITALRRASITNAALSKGLQSTDEGALTAVQMRVADACGIAPATFSKALAAEVSQ